MEKKLNLGKEKKLALGGQAVIEGVMIRSLNYNVVAIRKNKSITTKTDKIKQRKGRFYKFPVARGFYNLADMLVLGMRSLNWSAEQQLGKDEKISKKELTFTFVFAIFFGLGLFVFLPYFLTLFIGFKEETQPFFFNIIDGAIRIAAFLLYLFAISFLKDVQVLFQYHGAEHKAIHCFEHKKSLNIENIRKFTTLHPRCGTAFIMIVLVVAILTFSILTPVLLYLFPSLAKMQFIPRKAILFLTRIALIPLIAGISYEFLKFSAKYEKNPVMKIFIFPGLLMQKITTKEPNNKQIEVAMAAVKKLIKLKK